MKTLKTYIIEASILNDIDDTLVDGDVKAPHSLIQKYLEDNYLGNWTISEKPNKDGLYEVSSNENINVENTNIISLTNNFFIWTNVKGYFNCSSCKKLKSLKGAPKEVGGSFSCTGCKSLKTLEGASKKIESHFDCSYCPSLKSLDGAPEIVGGNFYCSDCGKLFTKDEAKKVSKINGRIYC